MMAHQGEYGVHEGNCSYNSYTTDNYRFLVNNGKFKQKYVENCFLRLSTLKDTEFYDELKGIKNAIDFNYIDLRRLGICICWING